MDERRFEHGDEDNSQYCSSDHKTSLDRWFYLSFSFFYNSVASDDYYKFFLVVLEETILLVVLLLCSPMETRFLLNLRSSLGLTTHTIFAEEKALRQTNPHLSVGMKIIHKTMISTAQGAGNTRRILRVQTKHLPSLYSFQNRSRCYKIDRHRQKLDVIGNDRNIRGDFEVLCFGSGLSF